MQQDSETKRDGKKKPTNLWSILQSIPNSIQTNWQMFQNWVLSSHLFKQYWANSEETTQFWRLVLFISSLLTSMGSISLAFYFWYQKLALQYFFMKHRKQWFQQQQQLSLSLREKIDELHRCYNDLSLQIDINKEAIEHNAKMQKYQEELEKKMEVRKQQVHNLDKERTTLQEQLQNCRQKIEVLEQSTETMKQTIESLHQEKSEQSHQIELLKHQLVEIDQKMQQKQRDLDGMTMELKKAEQTRKVFEYVMTKFSPDLALKVQRAMDLEKQIMDHQQPSITNETIPALSPPTVEEGVDAKQLIQA